MKAYIIYTCAAALTGAIWHLFSSTDAVFDPDKVLSKGREITSRSWEFGTFAQALLEFYDPHLTVFGSDAFPNGLIPQVTEPEKIRGLAYAKAVIWTNATDFLIGGEGSAADPASLGIATVLLSHHEQAYHEAARRQAEYLVNKAKTFRINATHLAMSHREDVPELWGDFIFMVPPFLAYYGVATQNMRFLEAAVSQCRMYDDVLRTSVTLENGQKCHGLWRHIASDPPKLDPGVCCSDRDVWLTSNAWAVAGMTRVLAAIMKWTPPPNARISKLTYSEFRNSGRTTLAHILASMLQCAMHQARDEATGLLKNYLDGPSHQSAAWAYGDAAGTAIMAATVYRLAVLLPEVYGVQSALDWADESRGAVARCVSGDGRVGPVADVGHVPSKTPVNQTSEGQSMVAMMYSAWRDCLQAEVCKRDVSWYGVRLWTWLRWWSQA